MVAPALTEPAAMPDGGGESALAHLRPVPRISIQAFCETPDVSEVMEDARHDRRMTKAQVRVQQGGIRAARELYAQSSTPNLVILESQAEPAALLSELDALSQVCDPGSKVVVLGHRNDVFLYRELMRRGISEYLVVPVGLADILGTVSQLFTEPDAEPLGRTIAFIGAKGGVGSSTIAHNVAWSIGRLFSTEVILADLDLPFGTANINFDQDPIQGIAEALQSADRLDDVLLDRLLSRCSEHLSLLAAPSLLDRTYDFTGEAFTALVDAAQRSTPVVVLDVPHGWSEWTRNVLRKADEIVLCATPDLPNLRNAKNLLDTLKALRPNDEAPRLVLNQVGVPKRPEIPVAEFVDSLGVAASATIPFDPHLFGSAANNGRMIGDTDAKHPVNESFGDLSHTLTGRSSGKRARRSGTERLLGLLRRR